MVRPKPFQAVVMAAGKGTRMTELTAGKPKCLLPIGNKPMVWYPLQMLERTGIKDTIVVVVEQARSEIQTALEKTGLKIKIDFVGIPAANDWGTADTLRFLADRIKYDILVVSCDFITDLTVFPMVDIFFLHKGLCALFIQPQDADSVPISTPGPKSKQKPERDLVGIDEETGRLVFLSSVSDFEETVPLSRSLLKKHPQIKMFSHLTDGHMYLLKRWVLDFLVQEKSFGTLKGETLPYIVKKQNSELNKQKRETELNLMGAEATKKDLFDFAQEDPMVWKIRELSFYNDHSGPGSVYHGNVVRCYAYVAPEENFGIRANTVAAYCEANRKVKDKWEAITRGHYEFTPIHPTSEIKSTQMDSTSMVGDQTKIAEKTSIKNCNIGARCLVESKVRMTNCILMNGVKVREGCVLSNSVFCDYVEIGSNTKITDCVVGSKHVIPADATHTNEVLTDVNRLMEI